MSSDKEITQTTTQSILHRDLGASEILHLKTNNARLWSVIKSMMIKAYEEGYECGEAEGLDKGYEDGYSTGRESMGI